MIPERLELTLRDGTPVVARPLTPADRDYVAEGYRRLSPEARYQRFWVRQGEIIGDAMLDRLLTGELPKHAIWTVFDPAREGFPALGAASFWRSESDLSDDEFSATVMDADRVMVLEGGKIVQSGSHTALMGQEGLYRRLVERQFVAA